jgi:succinoglycan biosynthesis protein ExoA
LNQAIRESRGEIIVRLDAHSMPIPEYVERCVAAHQAGKGDNVGGVWEIRPGAQTRMAEAISFAAAHRLGAGDAMYRVGAKEGAVDTVPFGSFRRELVERIGAFDETLLANEDYEFNTRVRESGGTVWLDPSIRSVYFSRSTLGLQRNIGVMVLEIQNAQALSAYIALAAGASAECSCSVYLC